MVDVFISHAREDVDVARHLAEDLQDIGLDTWWDRYLTAGDRHLSDILDKLKSARVVVVIWSPRSVAWPAPPI
jgi:hypothetical protein